MDMYGWMDGDEGGSVVIYRGGVISYIDRGGFGIWHNRFGTTEEEEVKG